MALYCDKACSALGRRRHKTIEQSRAEKSEYDRARRAALGEVLLEKKRACYYKELAENPELLRERQKANRDGRRREHIEYCRRPEYKEWKREYDRQHRAIKHYGPFAESFLALMELEAEVASRATRYEIYAQNSTLSKTQKRKREYEKAVGC